MKYAALSLSLVFCACAFFATANANGAIRRLPQPKTVSGAVLSQAAPAVSRRVNPFGVVEGIVPCGGQGSLVQVRVTDCTQAPCDLVTGRTYNIEFDFRPLQSHSGLHLKVMFHWHSEAYNVVEGAIADSAVEAGGAYTLTYPLQALGFIQGLTSFRLYISGQANEVLEVCGEIGTDIVPS